MSRKFSRRVFLQTGVAVGAPLWTYAALAESATPDAQTTRTAGALKAARILPDGWTMELDFLSTRPDPIEPHKLSVAIFPPARDFLGVSMEGVAAREARGVPSNINPWYDVDNPFPAAQVRNGVLTTPVRLDRPVRKGEKVMVRAAAGLAPGTLAATVAADNRSALMVCLRAQDRYIAGDRGSLLAEVDCLTGCRIPDGALRPASSLPTRFDPTDREFPNIMYDPKLRRVVVGAGLSDTQVRTLSGIDFRADAGGGYYVYANAPNVVIRDCLFDDANFYSVQASAAVTRSYRVYHNEMRGALQRTRGDFSSLPEATRGHGAFFLRHKECDCDVRLNRVHGSTNDGIIMIRGVCAQNAVYSQGWDNRPKPGHADGIWCPTMAPGAPKILVERNFVDSRDPGHGFYSITGSLSIALPPTQSHRDIPAGDSFFDGLEARWNLMLAHAISFNMFDGISGSKVPNDRRYVRGHNVHDNWMTAPRLRGATPLYPWIDPDHRWSPDGRWENNTDPISGALWTMGPQPKDMLFDLSLASPQARGGETVEWTLSIGRYLAQYGPETLKISQTGRGFARTLAEDVAAAIRDYPAVSYDRGVFTFRPGLVGRGVGQRNEDVRLVIRRTLVDNAKGPHALEISSPSAGSIKSWRADCMVG